MIIITNGQVATMYYSESQWLDVVDADFGPSCYAFRVPNTAMNSNIIGGHVQESQLENDKVDIKYVPPMTHQEVEEISTRVVFTSYQPRNTSDVEL
jgi:hypothetical protein